MRNISIYKYCMYLIGIFMTLVFTSCDDWTEIESTDIEQPTIADVNSALYEKYLQNLRDYKKSDHKCVIAGFNNSVKKPFNRSQHISNIPDSVDYVSLSTPDTLSAWEIKEMKEVRTKKGTKFLFTINFDNIKLVYDQKVLDRQSIIDKQKEGDTPPAELPKFRTFMVDTMSYLISKVNKYNYDGLCFAYKGKSIMHMTDDEVLEYQGYHNAFIGILKDWTSRNKEKELIFEGNPQNLLDKAFLADCKYIIIPCTTAGNASKIKYNIIMANVDGVPSDKFVVSVESVSLDAADAKTGYWADGKTLATEGASKWVATHHEGFAVKGMVIYNIGNDYFNDTKMYGNTRDAIRNINPSLNK